MTISYVSANHKETVHELYFFACNGFVITLLFMLWCLHTKLVEIRSICSPLTSECLKIMCICFWFYLFNHFPKVSHPSV